MTISDCLKTFRYDIDSHASSREKHILKAREDKIVKWKNFFEKNNFFKKSIIGISWRSSITSYNRDQQYFGLNDVVEFVNSFKDECYFFNLQYDECDDELKLIANKTGVTIINPLDIDQKNDLEDVAAIMS